MTESEERFQIVFAGHVDHGKSTLLGRIYADTDSLPAGHVKRVREICQQQGKRFEYAFFFDSFLEEQEQGITIDTARTFFHWGNRHYTILDAPGHQEFLKNMISGAARAEAAVLVIDAADGVKEQSIRHGRILRFLGIQQIVVVVNKMDLAEYSESRFRGIEEEYLSFLREQGITPHYVLPASAIEGENVVRKSSKMPWFQGPTVLESLAGFKKMSPQNDLLLRFPVQDLYKFDLRRIVVGNVLSGVLKVGDELVFSPSNKTATVKRIEAFHVPVLPMEVSAGRAAGFTLEEQIFIERGEIASLKTNAPRVAQKLKANAIWMGKDPLLLGKKYFLRLATQEMEMEVEHIAGILDSTSLKTPSGRNFIDKHEIAEIVIRTKKPLVFDLYAENECTGRFVMVDGYEVCGGGIILEALRDNEIKQMNT